ncbi:MAG: choice-of-anchor J domain-containing protein [bacterium]
MRILYFIFVLSSILFFTNNSFSQRILFQSDFENITLTSPDSLPTGWKKLDADSNFFGIGKSWAVRDTNQILGGDTTVNRPRAFSGKKSLHISWFSGKGGSYVSDDWTWTDSLRILTGDSLIFRALLGNVKGISYYVDSVQIWICTAQAPQYAQTKLTTLISNLDTNDNEWTEHKFDLSQFSGQTIYLAFRYYLPVQEALWCNIDDMFIGNRTPVGINQNSSVIPDNYILFQNFPNPFNPVTKIRYSVPQDLRGHLQDVSLEVFDISGKKISTLVREKKPAGIYEVVFDGSNFSSGTYFYKLSINIESSLKELSQIRKMILLK